MNQRDAPEWKQPDPEHPDPDHWEMFAEAMDLTIEGHRLIAEEIIYEVKLAWRGAVSWSRDLAGLRARRQSPPA
jgi:hypothetical protein